MLSGEDHRNKWVGISKHGWCKLFFSLAPESKIVDALIRLWTFTPQELQWTELNPDLEPLAEFIFTAYNGSCGPHTIPEIRWKLWSKKNMLKIFLQLFLLLSR